jgi:4-hydroxy-2-oxoglutarate aldolase
MRMDLHGIVPALTTPLRDGRPSLEALRRNLARYERLELGGYLLLGSTGEAPLLDAGERASVLEAGRQAIPPATPLVAGVSAESTVDAIQQAEVAAGMGADLLLLSTPHYFGGQMTADALLAHFLQVADASKLPLLLYNVPKFTHLVLPHETVLAAAEHPRIVGLKESSGDEVYFSALARQLPHEFRLYCGAAALVRRARELGAAGAMLAAAAPFPEAWIAEWNGGLTEEALARLLRGASLICGKLGVPGIKAALDARGMCGGPARSPLPRLAESEGTEIVSQLAELVDAGVLPAVKL